MKNFQPGGLRNRRDDIGGRPQSDVNKYAPKKRFDGKQSFGNKPAFGGGNRDKGDMKLYAAVCTTCGKSCEVPFRPDGSKPVLCRDCFANKNAAPNSMPNSRDRFTPNEMVGRKPERTYDAPAPKHSHDFDVLVKQLAALETKVNQILDLVKASEKLVSSLPIIGADIVSEEAELAPVEKKERKPKKVTPAIKKAAIKKKAAVAKKVIKKVVAKKAAAKKAK